MLNLRYDRTSNTSGKNRVINQQWYRYNRSVYQYVLKKTNMKSIPIVICNRCLPAPFAIRNDNLRDDLMTEDKGRVSCQNIIDKAGSNSEWRYCNPCYYPNTCLLLVPIEIWICSLFPRFFPCSPQFFALARCCPSLKLDQHYLLISRSSHHTKGSPWSFTEDSTPGRRGCESSECLAHKIIDGFDGTRFNEPSTMLNLADAASNIRVEMSSRSG